QVLVDDLDAREVFRDFRHHHLRVTPLRGFSNLAGGLTGMHRLIQESQVSLTLFEIGIDPSLLFCPSRPWSLRLSRDHCHGRQYASAKDLQYYSHRSPILPGFFHPLEKVA